MSAFSERNLQSAVRNPWVAGNFAASRGRIYRTTDLGFSWEEIFVEPYDNLVDQLTVTDDGDLFFISHLQLIDKSTSDSCNQYCSYLLRSTDMGETWDTIFNSMSIDDVEIMSDGHIYISTHFGLRRSSDGGDTWESVSEEIGGDILFYESRDLIYVKTFNQLYKSDDLGVTWTTTFENPGASYDEVQMNSRGDLIWTSIELVSEGQPNRFYISTDQGETWTEITPDNFDESGSIHVGNHDQLFIFTSTEMLRSLDHGATWQNMGPAPGVNDITQLANGQIYAAATSVWRSTSLVPVSNVSPVANELHLYPNPAKGQILVDYNGLTLPGTLRMYDSKGQIVKETAMQQSAMQLDISDLKKGIYIIKIGEESGKVVVY